MSESQKPRAIEDRFFAKVQESDGCWLWTAGIARNGYGMFRASTARQMHAHRWAWEFFRGVVPAGLVLDHLCRVRHCVNPEHLEPVSYRVNSQRGAMHRRGLPANTRDMRAMAREIYALGGYTQREVASLLNINQGTVSRALNGGKAQ